MFGHIFKNLSAKLLIFITIIGSLATYVTLKLPPVYLYGMKIPVNILILIPCVVIALYCYIDIIKPLQTVLHEMKALITGKRYKRIRTDRIDEIGVTGHFFNEITQNLERISRDLNEHKRVTKELDLAHQIQQNLLPKHAPNIQDLDFVAKTKPAQEIGGDSYDFMETEKNLFFHIGDVTGHGVPAGLVMIMVDTLLDTFIDNKMNTRDVLINTNKYLEPKLSSTMFMTMVLFRWEKDTKKLFYSGAGHEHIIIFRSATKKCETWASGGIALGMVNDNSKLTVEKEVTFESGDVLVLYSDGVTEGDNPSGELYGLKKLTTSVEKHGEKNTADEIFNAIASDFSQFIEGHVQDDDISLMVIKHK